MTESIRSAFEYDRRQFIPLSLTESKLVPHNISRIGQFSSTTYLKSLFPRLQQSSVHTLENATTRKLLSSGLPPSPNAPSAAHISDMHERLTELAPALSKGFTPKNNLIDEFVFRLIGDHEDSDNNFESYITLSYCWGVSETMPSPERTEDVPLPTSPAMFLAINNERKSEKEGLWVDKVCIDQENEIEKQISIGQMDLLYSCAREVVVALDDVLLGEEEAAAIAKYAAEYEKSDESEFKTPFEDERPRYMASRPLLVAAYVKIISSRWFERAWCFHEMRLGRLHIFFIKQETDSKKNHQKILRFTGTFLLHLDDLCVLFKAGMRNNLISVTIRNTFYQQVRDAIDFLHSLPKPANDEDLKRQSLVKNSSTVFALAAGGNPKQLDETLRSFDASCDKLSITLNISGHGFVINPDGGVNLPPTSDDECYRRLLLLAIAAGDPLALCTIGRPLRLTENPQTSWLCRPIPRGSVVSSHQLLPLSNKVKIIIDDSPCAEYIQLDMLSLKPLNTWHQPSTDNVEKADKFMDQCVQNNIGSVFWSYCPDEKLAAYIKLHAQTIASVFECGMEWVQNIYKEFVMAEEQSVRAVSGFSNLFGDSFEIPPGDWWDDSEKSEDARLVMSFINRLIWYGSPWHLQIEHFGDFAWRPICTSFGDDGNAMCFAPPNCEVFIVEVLKSKEYCTLERAWTLRKRNVSDDSSWTQLGKSCFFASAASMKKLDENPDFASFLPQQKVYGRLATTEWPPQIQWT